jgi:phosphate starvation-inducible PhoH-like protein
MMRAAKHSSALGSGVPASTRIFAPSYSPRGVNQEQYLQHLQNPNVSVVFGLGPAGTGKTLFACSQAVQDLRRGQVQKIVLTRPMVTVEEELGFLPGSINKKMDPFIRPLFDIFLEWYSQRELDMMLQNGVIEISPLAYMRGRTFKKCFIIADEMQNSSPNQMLMLATRIGGGSKMVITGDLKQTDRTIEQSGLVDFLSRFKNYCSFKKNDSVSDKLIELVELENIDIERSPVVSKILEIYDFGKRTQTLSSNSILNKNSLFFYSRNDDAAMIPLSHLSNKTLT